MTFQRNGLDALLSFKGRTKTCRWRPFLPARYMRAPDSRLIIRKESVGVNSYVQTRRPVGCGVAVSRVGRFTLCGHALIVYLLKGIQL